MRKLASEEDPHHQVLFDGDIIHALPVAHDIRQALPDARIDWVAEESFADIPPLAPAVEKVYVTAFRRWRNSPFSVKTRREVSALKAELQAEHYDIVIDIQGLIRSGLVGPLDESADSGLHAADDS